MLIESVLIGPKLPYDIISPASTMLTMPSDRVFLVGGYRGYASTEENLNTLFELDWKALSWKEIRLQKLRHGHLAFTAQKQEMKIFCGN